MAYSDPSQTPLKTLGGLLDDAPRRSFNGRRVSTLKATPAEMLEF